MDNVPLSVGSGGEEMSQFLEQVVFPALQHEINGDAALIDHTAFTIDSFVADPPIFPGGSVGTLAVSGSVNDLVAVGAKPIALAISLILEEGVETDFVRRILSDVRKTCSLCQTSVVTGDTKVVQRNAADRIFVTASGLGKKVLDFGTPRPGDKVLITGDIARHGAAMLVASNRFQLSADIASDCEPLHWIPDALAPFNKGIKWMRDPTRGGVATVLHEFTKQFSLGVRLFDEQIPILPAVMGICELLGMEPLHLASEGRMVIVVDPKISGEVLDSLHEFAPEATLIGEITDSHKTVTRVVGRYETFVPPLTGELLPRIC
jgi:hydrogenase expression/formation protein HypE